MTTIHKYETNATPGVCNLDVRKGAKLLKIDSQTEDKIAFWYEVDTHKSWERIDLIIYTTGQNHDEDFKGRQQYLGTVLLARGLYVLHVYQIKPATGQ